MGATLRREGLPSIFFALLHPFLLCIFSQNVSFRGSSTTPLAGTRVNSSLEHLTRFFDAFISLSFWQRLFDWKRMRSLSYSAYEEAKELLKNARSAADNLQESDRRIASLRGELELVNTVTEAK